MSRLTELPNITWRSPLSSYLERATIRTTIKWSRLKLRRHHVFPYTRWVQQYFARMKGDTLLKGAF